MSGPGVNEVEGVVIAALPNATFRVKLNNSDKTILCRRQNQRGLGQVYFITSDKFILYLDFCLTHTLLYYGGITAKGKEELFFEKIPDS